MNSETDPHTPPHTTEEPAELPSTAALPPEKTSYEASHEVQRWLRDQAAQRVGAKPPFFPTFLAHQRDRLWVLSSLERFTRRTSSRTCSMP